MAAGLLVLPFAGQPDEVLAVIGPYWLCLSASMLAFTHAMVVKNLLDAAGRPWLSVAVTVLPALLNVFFNWLLIYGHWGFPRLGLTGAGIASLAAQAIGAVVGWVVVRHLPSLRAWWGPRRFERAELARQWNEGRPMTVQLFLEGAAVAVAGVLIGLFGAVALAGNQIALSVGSTLYMLPLGVAGAVTIRIAQVIGAEQWPRVGAIGQAGLLVVTGWMGGFALLFLFAGAWIGGLFVDDPAVIAAAAAIFFVFGFTQLMDGEPRGAARHARQRLPDPRLAGGLLADRLAVVGPVRLRVRPGRARCLGGLRRGARLGGRGAGLALRAAQSGEGPTGDRRRRGLSRAP